MTYLNPRVPVIDLSPFEMGNPWRDHVAAQIDWAAAEFGIFQVINHGIDPGVIDSLTVLSRHFFDRRIASERRPHALAGAADPAEELYFDAEFPRDDAHALAALGAKDREVFFQLPGLRDVVRDYMAAAKGLAHRLMTSFARGLHLGDPYFVDRYTGNASTLFRIVNGFDALNQARARPALLTLVNHDDHAQLEVGHGDRVIAVPPVSGALVCAVGEPLELLTAGRYQSARYRLVSSATRRPLTLSFYFGAGIGTDVAATRDLHAEERARAA